MKQSNSKSVSVKNIAPAKKVALVKKKALAKNVAPAKKVALAKKTALAKNVASVKKTEPKKKTVTTKQSVPKILTTSIKVDVPAKAQPQKKNETAYRYSDEELNEFKQLINERLAVAREELLFLQGQMIGKDPSGAEDSSDLRLSLEDGSGAMDREQLSLLTSRQVQYISNLEKALIRIHNKTYGVCRETGKLIDKARLRAVPHATLSIEAKKNAAKK